MKQLTIKQAIDEGYTKYGFASRDWQTTQDLHDDIFDEVEPEDWDDIVLFEKESTTPSISAKEIAELLSDYIGDNDSEECMREDEQIYDAVKAIDFTDISEKINKAMESHKYWMLTDIKLVHNEL